jgi:hypothetical protein
MITSYINYPNPAPSVVGAALSLIDSTSVSSPKVVFTSTNNGAPTNRGGVAQENAITTIALCNTGAPTLTDETINSVTVNVYLVKSGQSEVPANLIVSNLVIPAGETVFFSEERLVLSGGDTLRVGTSASGLLAVTVSTLPV